VPDPFITRDDVTDYLGRDVASDDGALLCVEAACDVCRTLTEQTINRGTTTGTFDGSGTDALLLPELPVNSIGTVSVSDGLHPPTWVTAGTADYTLNGDGILYAVDTAGTADFGTVWPKARQNIKVTYDHGWTIGTAGDVPEDIRAVALMIASRLLIQGVAQFENLGDLNIRYTVASTDLTNGEKAILRKYRRAR
jgi:hypothetical protein